MKRVALTGGIACGKSLVARRLNELGVETIDADDVVHRIIPDPAERRRIAAEVFSDPAKRKALEARIHPIVRREIDEFLASAGESLRIAVIPLLFETHWDKDYDIICSVCSSRETQVERMTALRGYARNEAEARLGAQMPAAVKAAKSHYVINNDGSEEELFRQVDRFVSWLKNSMCSQVH